MTRLYSKAVGINNKVPAHRLPYSSENGVAGLSQAMDVLISITGELSGRAGSETIVSGSFHSSYPAVDGFYVSRDDGNGSRTLCFAEINQNDGSITLTDIRSGMSDAMIDFTTRGTEVFYCNGSQNGKLIDTTNYVWPENDWTGGETTNAFTKTPVGEHLGLLSGRILLSRDNELFYTEYGLPGLYDASRNRYRFGSKILMICEVATGVYVSDEHAVYFLAGTNPAEWTMRKVLDYPAIEWRKNPSLVPGIHMGLETTALCCLFGTVNGPVVGMPDGTPINLIEENVAMPECKSVGGIMVTDDTLILMS